MGLLDQRRSLGALFGVRANPDDVKDEPQLWEAYAENRNPETGETGDRVYFVRGGYNMANALRTRMNWVWDVYVTVKPQKDGSSTRSDKYQLRWKSGSEIHPECSREGEIPIPGLGPNEVSKQFKFTGRSRTVDLGLRTIWRMPDGGMTTYSQVDFHVRPSDEESRAGIRGVPNWGFPLLTLIGLRPKPPGLPVPPPGVPPVTGSPPPTNGDGGDASPPATPPPPASDTVFLC